MGSPQSCRMKKKLYTWSELEIDLEILAQRVKSSKFNPEGMVAITRGGLAIAAILSQFLNVRAIDTVNVYSYTRNKRRSMLKMVIGHKASIKRVLVVDDIVDTGKTAKKVMGLYPNGKLLTIFRNPKSSIEPDYCLIKTERWVIFPWEVLDKSGII